jgi:hypothetical protein
VDTFRSNLHPITHTKRLSRDQARIEALRRSLAAYRMVFGQARQEDLLAYLLPRLSGGETTGVIEDLRINLEPPQRPQRTGT